MEAECQKREGRGRWRQEAEQEKRQEEEIRESFYGSRRYGWRAKFMGSNRTDEPSADDYRCQVINSVEKEESRGGAERFVKTCRVAKLR